MAENNTNTAEIIAAAKAKPLAPYVDGADFPISVYTFTSRRWDYLQESFQKEAPGLMEALARRSIEQGLTLHPDHTFSLCVDKKREDSLHSGASIGEIGLLGNHSGGFFFRNHITYEWTPFGSAAELPQFEQLLDTAIAAAKAAPPPPGTASRVIESARLAR